MDGWTDEWMDGWIGSGMNWDDPSFGLGNECIKKEWNGNKTGDKM